MTNLIASLVPYAAVLIGMQLFHSAWLAILSYHAGIVLILFYRKRAVTWRSFIRGGRTRLLLSTLFVCGLLAPSVYFLWPWLAVSKDILPQWMAHYGLVGWPWLLFVPYFSIVHPILEELHWRGISPVHFTGICRQDILFSGYHVLVLFHLIKSYWLLLLFAMLAGSSMFWRWAAYRFGGYALPMLSHAAADTAIITAMLALLRHCQ